MEIREMTAARIGREIKRKNLGVRETAEAFLEEIRQQEPRIHAFLSVDRKKTLERVRQVEQGIRDGRYTGPLAGVPVAIKDNICTEYHLRFQNSGKLCSHRRCFCDSEAGGSRHGGAGKNQYG